MPRELQHTILDVLKHQPRNTLRSGTSRRYRESFSRIRLTIYARLECDWIHARISVLVPVRATPNSYFFFLSPPHFVNLIRILWTSSRSRCILTGRERDADAENWTTVKLRPASRGRKEGRVADAGRYTTRCVGVESSEIGRVNAAWFWFDFIPPRDDRSRRVRKGSRIRPLSSILA